MGYEPTDPDPERSSPTGFAAIKYTAIVVIVIAILLFLIWLINKIF